MFQEHPHSWARRFPEISWVREFPEQFGFVLVKKKKKKIMYMYIFLSFPDFLVGDRGSEENECCEFSLSKCFFVCF